MGQVLRTPDGSLHVIDFDGNPTRPAMLRAAASSVARDIAGMLMALENVAHVVRHHAPEVDPAAAEAWTLEVQDEFSAAYVEALGDRRDLFDEALLPAFEWEQLCREFVYAAPSAGLVRAARGTRPSGGGLMDPALFLADLEEKPARLRDDGPGNYESTTRGRFVGELDSPVVLLGHGFVPLRQPGRRGAGSGTSASRPWPSSAATDLLPRAAAPARW